MKSMGKVFLFSRKQPTTQRRYQSTEHRIEKDVNPQAIAISRRRLRSNETVNNNINIQHNVIDSKIIMFRPNLTKLKVNRSNERSSSVYPNIYTSNIMKNSREKLSKVFKRVKKVFYFT